jgi:hypothetical protein
MGTKKGHILNEEERKATENSVNVQKYNLALLQHKEKKILLEIEELPFRKKMWEAELDQTRAQAKTTQQAISDAEEMLRGE